MNFSKDAFPLSFPNLHPLDRDDLNIPAVWMDSLEYCRRVEWNWKTWMMLMLLKGVDGSLSEDPLQQTIL